MDKNQAKTLTKNPMNLRKAIQIGHFVLIIILVVIAGLYGVRLVMGMAGAYQCLNDPCKICEDLTGYQCEEGLGEMFCRGDNCFEINLTG